jgi:hypothetical protein
MMSPWLWLLWGVAALVILFIASAAFAAIWQGLRETAAESKPRPCPRCGFDPSKEDARKHLN